MACLRMWWKDVGCSPHGTASPDNNPTGVEKWNQLNGKAVRNNMDLFFVYACDGRDDYHGKCHGRKVRCISGYVCMYSISRLIIIHTLFCLYIFHSIPDDITYAR